MNVKEYCRYTGKMCEFATEFGYCKITACVKDNSLCERINIMDVEELRTLAKSMGYNIIPIKKREKLLPCTCGCNRREHWDSLVKGIWSVELRCCNCDKSAFGKSEADAIHNWNEMIRSEQDGCSNIKS